MRNTLAAGNLHAKTGTLTGVNALSGYLTDRAGRRLLFAAVANAAPADVSDLLDTAAVTLAAGGVTPRASVVPHVVIRDGANVECSWVPGAC